MSAHALRLVPVLVPGTAPPSGQSTAEEPKPALPRRSFATRPVRAADEPPRAEPEPVHPEVLLRVLTGLRNLDRPDNPPAATTPTELAEELSPLVRAVLTRYPLAPTPAKPVESGPAFTAECPADSGGTAA